MKLNFILFLLLIFSFCSCDLPKHYFSSAPECNSDTTNDLDQENQQLLINKLKNKTPEDYRYFFKTFKEEEKFIYMITNFRSNESCFNVKILVDKWDKLAGMKRTNGHSYPIELYDLTWEIKSITGKETVRYIDMHRIID